MILQPKEPKIRVGLMSCESIRLRLQGRYVAVDGSELPQGDYVLLPQDSASVLLDGPRLLTASEIVLTPLDPVACSVTVHDVTIGVDFHWQRKESQMFRGALRIIRSSGLLTVINELPLEDYLVSVISSEMSAACPRELLRAHAVVSRSWMMAQLKNSTDGAPKGDIGQTSKDQTEDEIIRWYDREGHRDFDVCADDHCQRYQGIAKAFSREVYDAVRDTSGNVLVYRSPAREEICDARYSKSCGGMTEVYSTAWEDKAVPYLTSVYDGPGELAGYPLPLSSHCNAGRFITSRPPAYCNTESVDLLSTILPSFDQETLDFYRWEVAYKTQELTEIVSSRLGIDLGKIKSLEPLQRGTSGRIRRLRITGERGSIVIGKELEIRRALSRTHLYSSAFVVRTIHHQISGEIEGIRLEGAGWGHGVGLCQIGAAVMAAKGHTGEEILQHYFRGAAIETSY